MKNLTIILILLIIAAIPALSQISVSSDPFSKFDHLTPKEGLSDNAINDIFQDSRGYLWIATMAGLNRFDGYHVRKFYHDPKDANSLSGNIITSLTEDDSGKIWIGTTTGLNYYELGSGLFARKQFTDSLISDTDRHIRDLLFKNNHLWIETAAGNLIKYDTDNGDYSRYSHNPPTMVNTYFYHAIYPDQNGTIWLGGRYMGIYQFDPENSKFSEYLENPADTTKKRDNDVAVYFRDSNGVFWVGGIDGLYTFDEKKETFRKVLPVSTFSIAEDRHGDLWVGTGNGIFIRERGKKKFRHIVHNDNNHASLIHNHINKIFIDNRNNIWIGTLDGISIFRPSKNKFRHIYHIPENANTPVSNHITCLLEDSQGRIWIGTANKGLECFDSNFNKLFQYNTEQDEVFNLVSNDISTLMEDDDGDIWVGLWSGRGFHIVNPDKQKNVHHRLHKSSLKADWYKDFLQDSDGKFWVGTWGAQGVYHFDKKNGKFTNERYSKYYTTFDIPVRKLAHDGKYIWPAIDHQIRVFCLDPSSSRFMSYSKDLYYPFDFRKITEISSDGKGKVWFNTDAGIFKKTEDPYFTFKKVNENRNLFTRPVPNNYEKIAGSTILSSAKDMDGTTWAGSYRGLFMIRNDRVEKTFTSQQSGLINDTIWSMDFHPPDQLWLGTNRGICMLNTSTAQFQSYNDVSGKYLSSHLTSFLFEDNEGFIWIGTTNAGVNRMYPRTSSIRQFQQNEEEPGSFQGKKTSCIFQDSKGHIWIGVNGLNQYHPEADSFSCLTTADGLAGNEIMSIQEDETGNLWISTKSGLSCLNIEENTLKNYYEKDGLQDNEFSRAGCRLKNGLILFGGKNGIAIIEPANLTRNEHPPQIALTSFKVFDKTMKTNFYNQQPIRLKYNRNYFSFSFTSLDFSDPQHNRFSYKLENFDEAWLHASAENRTARYTNVGPGKYQFRIRASNADGVWNETGVSIPVIISPPFWKTTWFIILEILAALLIIILIVRYRERKIQEQNRVLALEQKLLRSQMNPHFIFNSLSSIQSYIFENNPVKAGSYLSRFADLIRSILYNSREEFIALDKEIETLTNYLELQKLRYENKFNYHIKVEPDTETETISIPPMMAQPFIENAIEHGIKNLDKKGFIDVSFLVFEQEIHIVVRDNGLGIKATQKIKDKTAKGHRSLATVITRERLNYLTKSNKKGNYQLKFEDITDEGGIVSGTEVKIIIPFSRT